MLAAESGKSSVEESDGQEADASATADTLPPEPAQAPSAAEQVQAAATDMSGTNAARAAVAAASALPDSASAPAHHDTAAPAQSIAAETVGTVGAKPTVAHAKALSAQEHAELHNARTEAAKSPHGEAVAQEAGSVAKAPVKAEQPLGTVFDPTASSPHAAPAASAGAPAAHATAMPHSPVRVVAEVPLGAVPVEIGLKSLAGVNHFEIRLDPAELGRIEVRLEIDEEGGVKAHLTVDKVETLALLQRDSRSLERAFEQAGLKPTDGSVDLSLRDGQSQGQNRQEQGGEQRRDATRGTDPSRDDLDAALKDAPPRRLWRGAAGVDVRI